VRAAAYAFDAPPAEWPQHLIDQTPILTVQQPGTQEFSVKANGCGQVDVYGDFNMAALTLSPTLTASHTPYEPSFLDYFGSYKGGLSWYVDHSRCVTTTTTSPSASTTSATPTQTFPTGGQFSFPPETTTASSTTTTVCPDCTPVQNSTPPSGSVSGTSVSNTTTTPGTSVSGVSETNSPSESPAPGEEVLPFTGGNTGSMALFGVLGILAGLGLMVATRKPRRQ